MDDIHPRSWLSQGTIDAMAEEFSSSDSNVNWKANDLLLAESITLQEDFFWQSHTLSHLARDNLGLSDCYTEDTGEKYPREISMKVDAYRARYVSVILLSCSIPAICWVFFSLLAVRDRGFELDIVGEQAQWKYAEISKWRFVVGWMHACLLKAYYEIHKSGVC